MKTEFVSLKTFAHGTLMCGSLVAAVLCSSQARAEGTSPAVTSPSWGTQPNPPPPLPEAEPQAKAEEAPRPVPRRRVTVAPEAVDEEVAAPDRVPTKPVEERFLHGFRVGYAYTMNYDKPIEAFHGESLADRTHMRTPHTLLLGYEAIYRATGHSWLNVILVGNAMVGGLEQSQFYPTANTLIGFEFKNSFQAGVGANLAPLKDNIAHSIVAVGWTPRAGAFYVPVHGFFIPDVDGVHRVGVTTGVTW